MMRLTDILRIVAADGKVRVRRKDTGKITFVSPETLEKHKSLYEAPGDKPSKKQIRKEKVKEDVKRREETKETPDDEAPKKTKSEDDKGDKAKLIKWYLEHEGITPKEDSEDGDKPAEKPKPVRPDKKGKCPEGQKPKKMRHKGTGDSWYICVPEEPEDKEEKPEASVRVGGLFPAPRTWLRRSSVGTELARKGISPGD